MGIRLENRYSKQYLDVFLFKIDDPLPNKTIVRDFLIVKLPIDNRCSTELFQSPVYQVSPKSDKNGKVTHGPERRKRT